MKNIIYLDYAATTPVDARVAAKMKEYLTLDGVFGNPASKSHLFGWEAAEAVDVARNDVANLIGANSREVVFTSGATESDNLAIIGVALANKDQNKNHIITSEIEHKAILDCAKYVSENLGYKVTYLKPNEKGLITKEAVEEVIDDHTLLVSLMHANNEIGTITDIKAITEVAHKYGALMHSDCAQSAGKLSIDVSLLDIDYLSLCAHKIYGPKGIGAFYIKKGALKPVSIIHGGGHELGMRSGTLATHQIVGMGEAFKIAKKEMKKDTEHLLHLRQKMLDGLLPLGVVLNGDLENRLPNNLNLTFKGVDGEAFLLALRKIAVSTGSACTSASLNPSYVLKALGLNDKDALSSLRISFGRFTTDEEIDCAIEHIKSVYQAHKNNDLWS
jgi:cysteine desulfurase